MTLHKLGKNPENPDDNSPSGPLAVVLFPVSACAVALRGVIVGMFRSHPHTARLQPG